VVAVVAEARPVGGNVVRFLDRATKKELNTVPLDAPWTHGLWSYTPDGTRFLCSLLRESRPRGAPGSILAVAVTDPATGKVLRRFDMDFNQGYEPALYGITDKVLVAGGNEQLASIFDLNTGKELATLPGKTRAKAVSLSRDGRWLLIYTRDEALCVWDLEKRILALTLKKQATPLSAIAISHDGQHCAVLDHNATLRVFDREKGSELATAPTAFRCFRRWGLESELRFTPDGKTLIATGAGLGHGVAVWDWLSCREVRGGTIDPRKLTHEAWKREFGTIGEAQLAADGRTLLTVGPDAQTWIWDIPLVDPPPPPDGDPDPPATPRPRK
jgi:WD40 repeat protein